MSFEMSNMLPIGSVAKLKNGKAKLTDFKLFSTL